jgi:hypothetical protein
MVPVLPNQQPFTPAVPKSLAKEVHYPSRMLMQAFRVHDMAQPVTRREQAPAQIVVFAAREGKILVEPADLLEDVSPNQEVGRREVR